MKNSYILVLLFSIWILLCGCPYESEVPIDSPSIEINPKLLGIWKESDFIYRVEKLDRFRYCIYQHKINEKEDSTRRIAFLSNVNGVLFINLYNDYPGRIKLYKLLRMQLREDGLLILNSVSEKITQKFRTSNELKQFIALHMKDKGFFTEEMVLVNEVQIIQMKKDALLKDAELKKSIAINTAMTVGLAIILLVLVFLWYYYHSRRKTERLIAEKKEVLALLQGQNEERKRIATDLHDRLGSMLATVKVYFGTVSQHSLKFDDNFRQQFLKANELLDEACDEVRKISSDLVSDDILNQGLLSALNKLKETISKTNQIEMDLLAFNLERRLEYEKEVVLYRIVQELTVNVLRHSKANKLTVQLNKIDNKLNLIVEDNGIGFNPSTAHQKGGMGLMNIKERVKKLNGKLIIDSQISKGTTVIIEIPLV